MKTFVRIAASAMCLFLALCTYWAANAPEQDEHKGEVAPNANYKVREPCPPSCDERLLAAIIREADKGSKLVMTNKIER